MSNGKVPVIGAGIGGLATALSLHAAGIECEVFEQSRDIRCGHVNGKSMKNQYRFKASFALRN